VRWDEHGAELHRARVRGPVCVAFAAPIDLRDRRGGRLVARPGGDGHAPSTVVIGGGQVLEVRP
jgi:hypothetical protein